MHRNFLLPVGFVNDGPPTPAPKKSRTIKPLTRQLKEETKETWKEKSMENDSEDNYVQGLVINREDQETSSPVIGDGSHIAQLTNVDGDISFQNTSASAREIVQDEILEAEASQTESQQS